MTKDKAFYKSLLLIALPVSLKGLLSLGVVMLDNIMVGSLGEVSYSGVVMSNQITTLFTFFIVGASGGASVLISQYWGKQDMVRIKSIFAIVLQLALVASVVVMLLVRIFPSGALRIFTNEEDVIAEGIKYITIVCFSYVLFALTETMAAMLRCIEIVRITLIVSAISVFINLFFNYVLIYGVWGFPRMEVAGAALATVITRAVELAVVTIYVFVVQKRVVFRFLDLLKTDFEMLRDFLRYGAPIIFGDLQWGMVGLVKGVIIGHLGTQMITANGIAETIMSLAGIVTSGLGNAACVMIGKTVGAGEYEKTRSYSKTLQVLFFSGGAVMCALLFFTRGFSVSLYNIAPDTAQLATTLIGIGAFTLLGTFYHATCFTGINRGAGDGKFVVKVDMICGWLVVLPLSALAAFVFKWPLPVVFLCIRIDQCFKWFIAFMRLRGDKWIRNVTRA